MSAESVETEPRVVVMAPDYPPPTELTAVWARLLHARLGADSLLLEGSQAVRSQPVSACSSPSNKALAFFGHGHRDRLVAQRTEEVEELPLVDVTESQLYFTWVYALACLSACELGEHLRRRCERVFVGFDQELTFPHHDPRALTALSALATVIPLELHAGRCEEVELREKVRDVAAQVQVAEGGLESLGFMALNLLQQLQDFVLFAAPKAEGEGVATSSQ